VINLSILPKPHAQYIDFDRQVAVVAVILGVFGGNADAGDKLAHQAVIVDDNIANQPVDFQPVLQAHLAKRPQRRRDQVLGAAARHKGVVIRAQQFPD